MHSLGIYDSGVGGLSVYDAIIKQNPDLKIRYLADSEYFPLGQKSFPEIQDRLKKACRFLFDSGCDLVILACNTATVVAIRELQLRWLPTEYPNSNKNIIGISTPITELMSDKYWHLRSHVGVMLSTIATFRTGFYQSEFLKAGFNNFLAVPSDKLASMVEIGNRLEIEEAITEIMEPFKSRISEIQMVVLGCTHYHWVKNLIQSYFTDNTIIIDPYDIIAERTNKYINKHPEYRTGVGVAEFVCTGDTDIFSRQIKKFLDIETNVKKVII
jgi:glutamate racemase